MKTGPDRICVLCERTRPHYSRGLCAGCWDHENRRGALDDYPAARENRWPEIEPLLAAGWSHRRIARHLGMATGSISKAQARATVKKQRMDTPPAQSGASWERLYVPPPPSGEPECAGLPPAVFDVPQPSIRKDGPTAEFAYQLGVAFGACAECPLRGLDGWCVQTAVMPHRSGASIIAGGYVFVNGRRVWSLEQHEAWKAAREVAA